MVERQIIEVNRFVIARGVCGGRGGFGYHQRWCVGSICGVDGLGDET
jgi:hypothetical protein